MSASDVWWPGVLLALTLAGGEGAMALAGEPEDHSMPARLVNARDGLGNVIAKLERGGPVRIAYLGGSITAAPGWRVQTSEWFAERFPRARVEEIHAAVGGTGSDLGVFRLRHDVLRHRPDLLFVEFSVNDRYTETKLIWQAMEGIVRQTWATDSSTDIAFVYAFRTGYEESLGRGQCPRAASAMERLADHYGIPSINPALRIVELHEAGRLVYESDAAPPAGVIRFSSDGVHPLEEGHRIYTGVIGKAVADMQPGARPTDHGAKLATPFVSDHWQAAKMVPLAPPMLEGDWERLSEDHPLAQSFGDRMGTLWEADEPGSRIRFHFRGTRVGLYDLLGPDGGQVVVTVDGEAGQDPVPRFDSYSTYHRIATLALAHGLEAEAGHEVVVEIHPEQPDRTAVAFRLDDPETELRSGKYQGTRVRASQILLLGDLERAVDR